MIIILKSKVSLYSFKSTCCLAVKTIFQNKGMLHFWTDSRMVYVEKRRENTSQIASSACLRSSRSIGHHYVNVLRKNKVSVTKNGKKNQSFANKIGDTNLRTLSQ